MSTYILIWLIASTNALTSGSATYETHEGCLAAKKQILKDVESYNEGPAGGMVTRATPVRVVALSCTTNGNK